MSNTWIIYLLVENTFEKLKLILHMSFGRKMASLLSLKDELIPDKTTVPEGTAVKGSLCLQAIT